MRLTFGLSFQRRCLRVEVNHKDATYKLTSGDPLEITHYGETLTVAGDEPATRPIPQISPPAAPQQPQGREPTRRMRAR
jgi:alpha,alpha-trehalose phosphorylase